MHIISWIKNLMIEDFVRKSSHYSPTLQPCTPQAYCATGILRHRHITPQAYHVITWLRHSLILIKSTPRLFLSGLWTPQLFPFGLWVIQNKKEMEGRGIFLWDIYIFSFDHQKNLSSRFLLYLIYIFYIQPNRDSWQSRGPYLVLLTDFPSTRVLTLESKYVYFDPFRSLFLPTTVIDT
jgi:hypothetical protein